MGVCCTLLYLDWSWYRLQLRWTSWNSSHARLEHHLLHLWGFIFLLRKPPHSSSLFSLQRYHLYRSWFQYVSLLLGLLWLIVLLPVTATTGYHQVPYPEAISWLQFKQIQYQHQVRHSDHGRIHPSRYTASYRLFPPNWLCFDPGQPM
jgi:hypothetical protein